VRPGAYATQNDRSADHHRSFNDNRRRQQPMPVIGFLNSATAGATRPLLGGFRQGLRQTGYVEGQNVHIAFRWAEGRYDRLPDLAAELVALPVAVIAAFAPAALAARSASKTIPIVFISSADPVRLGIVASLNQPGGLISFCRSSLRVLPSRMAQGCFRAQDQAPEENSPVFSVLQTKKFRPPRYLGPVSNAHLGRWYGGG
jgi:hypothetical protein